MPKLGNLLDLNKCPHCSADRPSMGIQHQKVKTQNYLGKNMRYWGTYCCARCGGCVLAFSPTDNGEVSGTFPSSRDVDRAIPSKPREYLDQAIACLHSPAGAVMLAASAVDSMLKEKGYKDGSLYKRIDLAAGDHMITEEMAKWAHKIRLDANDQRHADDSAPLPTEPDAQMTVEFALALGEFLFVLPERIRNGLNPPSS